MASVQTGRLNHLIDTKDLSREEIDHLLERARYWERKGRGGGGPLPRPVCRQPVLRTQHPDAVLL